MACVTDEPNTVFCVTLVLGRSAASSASRWADSRYVPMSDRLTLTYMNIDDSSWTSVGVPLGDGVPRLRRENRSHLLFCPDESA